MNPHDPIQPQFERFAWLRDELTDHAHAATLPDLHAVLHSPDSRLPDVERALVTLAMLGTWTAGELLWQWEPTTPHPRIALLLKIARREWENRYASTLAVSAAA